MINYIESPAEYNCVGSDKTLFLAGGISECWNWQKEFVSELDKLKSNLTILNPRRANFEMSAETEWLQIKWEHIHLLRADAILFWFPSETLCPITLYELGAWNCRPKRLFIGCHPDYKRLRDVQIQVQLEPHRIKQKIHTSFCDLIDEVIEWEKSE